MFMRIQRKRAKDGAELLYASLCRCDWVDGRPRQTTVAYLGRVDEWQAELLRAAYSDRRPRVIWEDEGDAHSGNGAQG